MGRSLSKVDRALVSDGVLATHPAGAADEKKPVCASTAVALKAASRAPVTIAIRLLIA
jgi:hypothetical protein